MPSGSEIASKARVAAVARAIPGAAAVLGLPGGWIDTRGMPLDSVPQGEVVPAERLVLPVIAGAPPESAAARPLEVNLEAERRVLLAGARVFAPHGAVADSRGKMRAEFRRVLTRPHGTHRVLETCRPGPHQDLPVTTALLGGGFEGNYHHWIFDVLPQLALLRAAGRPWNQVLTAGLNRFQCETLGVLAPGTPASLEASGR